MGIERRSDVEAFGCPYRYQKLVLEGVDDTSEEAVRGRAVHVALYLYIVLLVNHRVDQDHELAREAFVQGLAISPVPDRVIDDCEKLFFRFVEYFELDQRAYHSAEDIFQTIDGRRFRPDLLYIRPQEVEIVDFKTHYKALTKAQARRELQLRWYLTQALKAFPNFPAYRFTFWFIRLNVVVSLVFTPEEIEQFAPGVDAQVAAITRAEEQKAFPALPGAHCTLCRLNCPVLDQVDRLQGRVHNLAEAQAAGGEILALEQRLKAKKKALAGWCQTEGPVHVGGQTFAYRGATGTSYPVRDAALALGSGETAEDALADGIAALDEAGLTVTRPMVDKAIEETSGAVDEKLLAGVVIAKTTYRLGHQKTGEVHPDGAIDVLAARLADDEGE